jgi:hypothetical protein
MAGVLAGCAVLAIATPLRADLRRLPGPMPFERLAGFLDAVGASSDQRQAVESMHTAYVRAYRARRTTMIDAAGPADTPPRMVAGDLEELQQREATRLQRLRQRWQTLRTVDTGFRVEVASLFDPAVAPRLEAVWVDRLDAAWLEVAGNRLNASGMDLDLAALVTGLIPPADPRGDDLEPVIEAAVGTWRSRRSRLVEAWATASLAVDRSVAQRLLAAGVDAQDDFLAQRDAWHGAQAEVLEAAVALAHHHRAAVEGLARQLPPDLATRLRSRWRAADLPSQVVADGPLVAWLDDALERLADAEAEAEAEAEAARTASSGPDPDLAMAIRIADRTHRDRLNELARDLSEAVEARDRSEASYQSRYQLAGDPNFAELATAAWKAAEGDAAAERDAVDAVTRDTLRALLTMPGAAALGLRPVPERAAPAAAAVPEQRSISMATSGELELNITGADPEGLAAGWGFGRATRQPGFLPLAVTADEAIAWARRLGIGAEDDPIVGALHADYNDRWRATRSDGAAGRADRAAREFFVRSADGTVAIPKPSEAEAVLEARRIAFGELAGVDDTLLEELAILSPLDEQPRDQVVADIARDRVIARLRSVLTATSAARFSRRTSVGGDDEPRMQDLRLDLAEIAEGVFEDEMPAELTPLIAAWKAELVPTLEAMVDAQRADRRGQLRRLLDALERMEDGTLSVVSMRFPATLPDEDPQRQWMVAARALRDLNRTALDRLRQLAAGEDAEAVEDAIWRARFPENYRLPDEADAAYRAAVAGPELAPEDRAAIEASWGRYVAAWEDLARRMSEADTDYAVLPALFAERQALTEEAMAEWRRLRSPVR